jgi:hypothetical protein
MEATIVQPYACVPVPRDVDTCPDCGRGLNVSFGSYDPETGEPDMDDVSVNCDAEPEDWEDDDGLPHYYYMTHRHYQSDWQPVIDRGRVWALARYRIDTE